MSAVIAFVIVLFVLDSCTKDPELYRISGSIEEPQNEVTRQIVNIFNSNLSDSLAIVQEIHMTDALDSIASGRLDFAIVDNYTSPSDQVVSILPLYPQVLHVLHLRTKEYETIESLLIDQKVFAGSPGTGTYRFVKQLMEHYGIKENRVKLLSDLELFEADVIFSFTDLLSYEELRDLGDYKLFSFDDVDQLGKGSLAEGICLRYPQFDPYILAKNVYGDFMDGSVLTVKVDAVLVCRADISTQMIYDLLKLLDEDKHLISRINPLLFDFSGSFDANVLNFNLHEGAQNYLQRYEPTFVEKYAEVFSVIISIFVALISTLYSISRWQRTKKKNKIDVYYNKLILLRNRIADLTEIGETKQMLREVKMTQEETINLVIKEKLLADESFSIFLNLSKIVTDEITSKESELSARLMV
ncbi:hypothetical protein FNH22_16750 [Fulvivirga sp. M361]|uniref:TAXI family TRAP transporter solute-binding subunit n=1 Tax=Fulvivirga sp. M361 TaxID=2594266 RepID=UPI00117AE204|nr:TAXI family TRAP transporter solute-binding subunit [Fulvivirga sp. M361]TRX56288.1 hypothetical protein FNH22_16750 [Fulvivirga sp. M361]